MTYRIRATEAARADLDRHLGWLARRAPEIAERLAQRYHDAQNRLRMMPYSCGLAYENRWMDEEVRHLLFWVDPRRKDRALFVVREDEVVVLAVRAPGERPVEPGELSP